MGVVSQHIAPAFRPVNHGAQRGAAFPRTQLSGSRREHSPGVRTFHGQDGRKGLPSSLPRELSAFSLLFSLATGRKVGLCPCVYAPCTLTPPSRAQPRPAPPSPAWLEEAHVHGAEPLEEATSFCAGPSARSSHSTARGPNLACRLLFCKSGFIGYTFYVSSVAASRPKAELSSDDRDREAHKIQNVSLLGSL